MTTHCLNCNKVLEGRQGKKFCNAYCKSNFHYEKNKDNEPSIFRKIESQLKKNRKILKKFNQAGKATVRENHLMDQGFNPRVLTHYWKNAKGGTYLFCFEFGFMKIRENNRTKYSLIKWQAYMSGVLDHSP